MFHHFRLKIALKFYIFISWQLSQINILYTSLCSTTPSVFLETSYLLQSWYLCSLMQRLRKENRALQQHTFCLNGLFVPLLGFHVHFLLPHMPHNCTRRRFPCIPLPSSELLVDGGKTMVSWRSNPSWDLSPCFVQAIEGCVHWQGTEITEGGGKATIL